MKTGNKITYVSMQSHITVEDVALNGRRTSRAVAKAYRPDMDSFYLQRFRMADFGLTYSKELLLNIHHSKILPICVKSIDFKIRF